MRSVFIGIMFMSFSLSALSRADDMPKVGASKQSELEERLRKCGFEVKKLDTNVLHISVEHDNWKVHIVLSYDEKNDSICLESKFSPVPNPKLVSAEHWLKLLEATEKYSPTHFSYDPSDNRVHLYREFAYLVATEARLKQEINAFDLIVRKTEPIWRKDNFADIEHLSIKPRQLPKKDPFDELSGTWYIIRVVRYGQEVMPDKNAKYSGKISFLDHKAYISITNEDTLTNSIVLHPRQQNTLTGIDFIANDGKKNEGVYTFDAGLMRICFASAGSERPIQFLSSKEAKTTLMVLERKK